MIIFVACPNSDGLSKFAWSHDGFWTPGGTLNGFKKSASKCAEACVKDNACVAINYHHSGTSPKACNHYYDRTSLNDRNQKNNEFTKPYMKSYIKCQGT